MANPKFEDSYGRLFGPNVSIDETADPFFAEFYRRFLEVSAIGALFTDTDMARQIAMLKHSLFHLVSYYVANYPSAELERLATFHKGINVSAEMFDDWLEALIGTVKALDPEADEATLLAWCWALTPGITYMRMRISEA
ncbi:MAG: globin [Pseudomonadales bacterium]|nr:globin [Pseudomonadales bacterium]